MHDGVMVNWREEFKNAASISNQRFPKAVKRLFMEIRDPARDIRKIKSLIGECINSPNKIYIVQILISKDELEEISLFQCAKLNGFELASHVIFNSLVEHANDIRKSTATDIFITSIACQQPVEITEKYFKMIDDVEEACSDGLITACEHENIPAIHYLMKTNVIEGLRLNRADWSRELLDTACILNHVGVIWCLIQHGANIGFISNKDKVKLLKQTFAWSEKEILRVNEILIEYLNNNYIDCSNRLKPSAT